MVKLDWDAIREIELRFNIRRSLPLTPPSTSEHQAQIEGLSPGQMLDATAGMIPLPIREPPERVIPVFPDATYNFLKR